MNSKQFPLSQRKLVSFVSAAVLFTLTTIPALASDDLGKPDDQPIRCCVVIPGDQTPYLGDCFGPGQFPRLPLVSADSQDLKLTRSKDKE